MASFKYKPGVMLDSGNPSISMPTKKESAYSISQLAAKGMNQKSINRKEMRSIRSWAKKNCPDALLNDVTLADLSDSELFVLNWCVGLHPDQRGIGTRNHFSIDRDGESSYSAAAKGLAEKQLFRTLGYLSDSVFFAATRHAFHALGLSVAQFCAAERADRNIRSYLSKGEV
jgi:hypothetical protein